MGSSCVPCFGVGNGYTLAAGNRLVGNVSYRLSYVVQGLDCKGDEYSLFEVLFQHRLCESDEVEIEVDRLVFADLLMHQN